MFPTLQECSEGRVELGVALLRSNARCCQAARKEMIKKYGKSRARSIINENENVMRPIFIQDRQILVRVAEESWDCSKRYT